MPLSKTKKLTSFVRHNLKPFRPCLAAQHTARRAMSAAGLISGMRIMDIALTYRCNLSCGHCSAADFDPRGRRELAISDIKTLADYALDMDFLSINLTGGEPLIRPDIYEIVSSFNNNRLYISVQSNMLLLSYEMAKRLKDCGVNCITTSIDSYDPDEHDSFRGQPHAYHTTFKAIEIARKAGLSVLVGGTITHQNIRTPELEKLIQKVNSAGAVFLYNLAVPCGNWLGNHEVCITPDDRSHLEYLLDKYPLSSTDHEPGRNAKGCPAGMEKIYITAYGDIIPCPFIHVSFGNIHEQALPDIVKRMQMSSYFNQFQPICIAAEDETLHHKIFALLSGQSLPVSWRQIPVLAEEISAKEAVSPAPMILAEGEVTKEYINCTVCGSKKYTVAARGKDFLYRTSADDFQMVRCSDCGLLYLNPRPLISEASKIYPSDYYTLSGEMSRPGLVARLKEKILIKRLDFFDFKKANVSILDCGCGDCSLLLSIKRRYPAAKCTGIDLNFSEYARKACAEAGIILIESTLESADLAGSNYDLIIMNQLIEHLWEPRLVLRNIINSLKPGGKLSVSTVNTNGYDRPWFAARSWGGYYFPRHLNLFSDIQLENYLESFGLKICMKKNLLAPVIWLNSLEAAWGPEGKGKVSLPRPLFAPTNPVSMSIVTCLEILARFAGRTTSNQITVMQKDEE